MNDKYNLFDRLDNWDTAAGIAATVYELGLFNFFKGSGFDLAAFLKSVQKEQLFNLCNLITGKTDEVYKSLEIAGILANFLSCTWRKLKESPEFSDMLAAFVVLGGQVPGQASE